MLFVNGIKAISAIQTCKTKMWPPLAMKVAKLFSINGIKSAQANKACYNAMGGGAFMTQSFFIQGKIIC